MAQQVVTLPLAYILEATVEVSAAVGLQHLAQQELVVLLVQAVIIVPLAVQGGQQHQIVPQQEQHGTVEPPAVQAEQVKQLLIQPHKTVLPVDKLTLVLWRTQFLAVL
jgi:hypothetical protein